MSTSVNLQRTFESMVVFGESLSDTGNAGRATNGRLWVEYLASTLKLSLEPTRVGGSNYAIGGARLDPRAGETSLRAQADGYLGSSGAARRAIYIVYGGSNDLLDVVGQPQAFDAVDTAVRSLKTILTDLTHQGATDILMPNLPGLGIAPAVQAQGVEAIEAADTLARRFNEEVDKVLCEFGGDQKLRLYRLDVWGLAARIRADPATAGFTNITSGCEQCDNCDGYLFWDDVHPTTAAHRQLADAAAHALMG
jgi:outer membrane lipase/esterase